MPTVGIPAQFLLILTFSLLPLTAMAESWTVKLTQHQRKALAATVGQSGHSAFAAAPGGQWGYSRKYATATSADAVALGNCQAHLSKGDSGCVIVARNGKMAVGKTVDVAKVTEVYKPINGRKAIGFFGLVSISFQGNRDRAIEQFDFSMRDGQAWRSIPKDRALERALTGRGLVWSGPKGPSGWAIFLGENEAIHYANSSRGKVLVSTFKEWAVSEDGLLCMFFGRWANGNPRSTNCMIIETAENGEMRYTWASNNRKLLRKGYIIAGDPGKGAAR